MLHTRNQIQTLLSQLLGDHVTGTATGGAAGGATLTTTDGLRQPGAKYSFQYLEITDTTDDAAPINEVRLVNTSSVSSGVLTLTPHNAFSAIITSGDTFAIHRFDPVWKQEAINEVLRELHAILPPVIVEDIISGECIRNGQMEHWIDSSNPYDWTASGTVTKETTTVYQGVSSLKMASGAAATVKQPVYLSRELYGVTINFRAYVYQSTAHSGTKLRLTQGSTDTDGTALSANATWTEISVNLSVADIADPIYATLVQGNSANATYWDNVRLLVPSTAKSSVDWLPYSDIYSKLHQVQQGYQQGVTKSVVGGHTVYPSPEYISNGLARWPYRQRMNVPIWMRMIGTGRYPNLTAGSDTLELNKEEARLVAAMAAMEVLNKAEGYEFPLPKEYFEKKRKELSIKINILMKSINRNTPTLLQPVPTR